MIVASVHGTLSCTVFPSLLMTLINRYNSAFTFTYIFILYYSVRNANSIVYLNFCKKREKFFSEILKIQSEKTACPCQAHSRSGRTQSRNKQPVKTQRPLEPYFSLLSSSTPLSILWSIPTSLSTPPSISFRLLPLSRSNFSAQHLGDRQAWKNKHFIMELLICCGCFVFLFFF